MAYLRKRNEIIHYPFPLLTQINTFRMKKTTTMKSRYHRQVPIFSHSDNTSLHPHQSTASRDGEGKHRQSLCSFASDG